MKEGVADDMRQSYVVMKNEMTKFFRGKRMLLFLGLVVAVFLLITVLPYLVGESLSKDPEQIILNYISFVPTLILLAATLFASVTIVSEYEERTALILFTRPIKKSSIFIGKLLASLIIGMAFVVLYYLFVALISLIFAGGIDPTLAKSLLLAIMYVIGSFGVAILISSIMKKASTSTIITFVVLMLLLPIFSLILSVNVDVWWMLDQASNAISYILPGNASSLIFYGIPVPSVPKESLVMVVWGLVSSVAAYFLFKRREF